MITLAIDPGPAESAYCFLKDYHPLFFEKVHNNLLRRVLWQPLWRPDLCAIEMVASYGMPVGREVFETCYWIGRFDEALHGIGYEAALIERQRVRLHFCHSVKAKDGNVAQALRNRFGDKGTKAKPGWFYGFSGDIWQAYALAVYAIDTQEAAA